VHAPFAYSPPAREQVAAEFAQAATQKIVTPRTAPIPVTALVEREHRATARAFIGE